VRYAIQQRSSFLGGGVGGEGHWFFVVAEAVVEEYEEDDEGAHAGAVEVEFVLH